MKHIEQADPASNRDFYLPYIEQAMALDLKNVIFALRPRVRELRACTHPLFRVKLALSGRYTFRAIQGVNGISQVIMHSGLVMFCQQRAATLLLSEDNLEPYEELEFVFWPKFIRFLFSTRNDDGIYKTLFFHSQNQLSVTGNYILLALDGLALTKDEKGEAPYLIKALLHACYKNLLLESDQHFSKSYSSYQNIMNYIHEHYHLSINRENVANIFQMSPANVSRLFQRYGDYGFNTTVKLLRLEHTLELIKSSDLSICEIAQESGFKSVSHFVENFRNHYGVPPAKYRMQYLQNEY